MSPEQRAEVDRRAAETLTADGFACPDIIKAIAKTFPEFAKALSRARAATWQVGRRKATNADARDAKYLKIHIRLNEIRKAKRWTRQKVTTEYLHEYEWLHEDPEARRTKLYNIVCRKPKRCEANIQVTADDF